MRGIYYGLTTGGILAVAIGEPTNAARYISAWLVFFLICDYWCGDDR